jgi:hypothetical protein
MASKRAIVELLTSAELVAVARRLAPGAAAHDAHEALVEGIVAEKDATLPKILAELPLDRLKELCRAAIVDDSGSHRPTLIRASARSGAEVAMRHAHLPARAAQIIRAQGSEESLVSERIATPFLCGSKASALSGSQYAPREPQA